MDEKELALANHNADNYQREGEELEEEELRPEDAIPDLPENQAAREFLKKAPTKGLFMPLGKEVKVMQCWRCKAYGHRTGDRECPMRESGNKRIETIRQTIEDPMCFFVESNTQARQEKYARVEQLKALMVEIRAEEAERKRRKKEKKRSREAGGGGDTKDKESNHKKHRKDKHRH